MKTLVVRILVVAVMFMGCNNSQKEEQLKYLSNRDSVLLQQTQQKDSTIMSYVRSLNEIQDNLNAIKSKEHIISMTKESGANTSLSGSIVQDIKSLDAMILRNNRQIYYLERNLKSSNKQDEELKKMVANLSKELSEKDAEIADLEIRLARTNDSLRLVVSQFNDSMVVINRQKMEINAMKTEINTVYYAIGTYKELKQKGVLTREGSVIGLGGTAALKQDFNTSYFTSALLPDLQSIPLYSKFSKLVTNHPTNSYKVVSSTKGDSFMITDAASFWSQSKYLVIIVNSTRDAKKDATSAMAPPSAQ